MFARKIVRTLSVVALLGVLGSSAVGAFIDARRTTYFTFSRSVQLPGVTLPAGTYIFEIANPDGGSNAVVVRSRDRSKVWALKLTQFVYRAESRDLKPTIAFGEAPAGTPPPVKAWYPINETLGREFLY
jgi:hypothetical protein